METKKTGVDLIFLKLQRTQGAFFHGQSYRTGVLSSTIAYHIYAYMLLSIGTRKHNNVKRNTKF